MSTLLKDLPEHKERIENNFHLKNDIRKQINTAMRTYNAKPETFADNILDLIATFVNENYEWKGIKA